MSEYVRKCQAFAVLFGSVDPEFALPANLSHPCDEVSVMPKPIAQSLIALAALRVSAIVEQVRFQAHMRTCWLTHFLIDLLTHSLSTLSICAKSSRARGNTRQANQLHQESDSGAVDFVPKSSFFVLFRAKCAATPILIHCANQAASATLTRTRLRDVSCSVWPFSSR